MDVSNQGLNMPKDSAPAIAPDLARRTIDAIRFLAIDMVEAARCGHPGAPMGMAPLAYVLWTKHLRHDPSDPSWPNRDRFVLSNGHASALLYALLHLTGYDLPLEELRRFRQWGSLTPGHPEVGLTPGVETTTGPLGQGFANGVGMAIAEAWLGARFRSGDHPLIDHHVYATVSDGDLQEGLSSEAASLAGTLRLGKLIYLYDDNGIQIEGSTSVVFREDVAKRFDAYGWHVVGPIDGNDLDAIDAALTAAKAETARPSLVICRTTIGYGAPTKAGTAEAHGAALGAEEVEATRRALGWSHPPFVVPDDVRAHARDSSARGRAAHAAWQRSVDAARQENPALVADLEASLAGRLPDGWDRSARGLFGGAGETMATRSASGKVLNALARDLPNLIGGSADLGPSNNTEIVGSPSFSDIDRTGRNLHFGVREHAMGAIASGIALHGGVLPYTGTFLTFSDYMRPAIRLAAMMELRVVYVFTHDSIGLGEDGPTHQPIEHISALRAIPGLTVVRPGDAAEVREAWFAALADRRGPTALLLTRQAVPVVDRSGATSAEGLRRGAYVLRDPKGAIDLLLIGTGSELGLVAAAAEKLSDEGIGARVVSMPSWEIFEEESAAYRDEVLPPAIMRRLAVEAGVSHGWSRWIGPYGATITIDRFGASAPADVLFKELGFTVEHIVERARALVSGNA